MKIEYLQKIIARVRHQIHCPKCKQAFAETHIEIRSVKGQQVEFSAECAHCQARSHIAAEISTGSKAPVLPSKAPLSSFELPKSPINDEKVKTLGQSLRAFKGGDVKNLFE